MESEHVAAQAIDVGDAIPRGAAIGRYVVLGLIGRGGMGDVYSAWDPELDRKIALKLLRTRTTAGQSVSEGRARLLREAQAIAKLSHPNVVVVYDVGMFQDAVFIAMEFIDGNTVRYWLHARERSWREILRVFLPAGRGLAAAHDAGVVHRDFKPDNLMVGRDGKVRVMDFGLARQAIGADAPGDSDEVAQARALTSKAEGRTTPTGAGSTLAPALSRPRSSPTPTAPAQAIDLEATRVLPPDGSAGDAPTRPSGQTAVAASALEANLTISGAILGTPAYMAPEQFSSKVGDARTDEFSFCVSLYESLYGERPFAGKSFTALMTSVVRGTVKDAPAGTHVPSWIRKVLLRGLRPSPDTRYPSMNALLAALEKDPSVARRRWAAVAGTALLAAVVALAASRSLQAHRSPCEGGAAKLAGVWEPGPSPTPRKQAIRAAFQATGKSYAERTFANVKRVLDVYVVDWTAMYADACEATAVRGEQSSEVLDLRMSCLQGRLESIKALTNVFAHADGAVVERAATAVNGLGALDRCADVAVLRAIVKPPDDPSIRARVDAIRPRLAEVKALTDAGRMSEAALRATPLAAEARVLGYLPVKAEAVYRLGRLSFGQPAEEESLLDEAMLAAEAGGDDELFAEAAIFQVYVIGYLEGEPARAWPWSRVADAALHRIGGHDILRSWLLTHDAALFAQEGHYEESASASRQSVVLREKALGPDDRDVAVGLGNLAIPLAKLGRLDEALAVNARALRIYEKDVGYDHPDVAMHLTSKGEILNALSRFLEAEEPIRRALEIWERTLGPEHGLVGFALTALGRNYLGRGRAKEAVPYLERAYAIRLHHDPEPSRLGETAYALAQALWQSKRDRRRAVTLATAAERSYANTPEKLELDGVNRWLRDHRPFPL